MYVSQGIRTPWYTLPVTKKDLRNKSKPTHDEKENEEQMETGRIHQSFLDRRAIEKPEAVTRHSEESQRRIARTCIFIDNVPFFPWIVQGTAFAWGRWPFLSKVVLRRTRDQKHMYTVILDILVS